MPAPAAPPSGGGGSRTAGGVSLYTLLPMRLWLGYAFAHFGYVLSGAFVTANELHGVFGRWGSDNPYPVARAFLTGRGQLWSELIAYVVAYGALAIGIALISGLFTRAAAFAGTALALAIVLLGGHTSPAIMMQGQLTVVALFTLATAGAGRVLGMDGWLHRRAPVMPFTLLY